MTVAIVIVATVAFPLSAYVLLRDTSAPSSVSDLPPPSVKEEARPAALWVGDSFAEGTGAGSRAEGAACQVAGRMGWVCNLDAQGGTGFVNDGSSNNEKFEPLIERLDEDRRNYYADVVVIDAGRNDGWSVEVETAMREYVAAVDEAYPRAELVMILPFYMTTSATPYGGETARVMGDLMDEYDGHLIDPFASGWMPVEDPQALLWEDDIHPNERGHDYLADNLVRELKTLGLDESVKVGTRP